MKVSSAFPSKYLKVEDLDDQDLTLTINKVTVEELGQGSERQSKLIIYFDEVDKGCALNKTNANVIAKLYGDDTDDWIGKAVTLWPNHDVEFKGEIVSAIRVRSRAPRQQARPISPANNGVMTYKQAVAYCSDNGITEDVLREHLKASGFPKWNSEACTPVVRTFVDSLIPPDDKDDDLPPF